MAASRLPSLAFPAAGAAVPCFGRPAATNPSISLGLTGRELLEPRDDGVFHGADLCFASMSHGVFYLGHRRNADYIPHLPSDRDATKAFYPSQPNAVGAPDDAEGQLASNSILTVLALLR